jgi:hypothetical protein
MRRAAFGLLALLLLGASPARAEDAGAPVDAGAPEPEDAGVTADAGADAGAELAATCIEHVPEGAARPVVKEDFPHRGTSGYAAELRLNITHGKGETVLPEGFRIQADSDAARALAKAGFAIPDPSGGVAPAIRTAPAEGARALTTLVIPLVPLPEKPGRNPMVLPPLPIAISRANNELITVCTQRHTITVEDPIANVLGPKVKPNPPARPQREDWPLARNLAIGIPIGIAVALAAVWLHRWWQRRPKPVAPKPKIPPWVVALAELEQLRQSDLIADGKTGEYFDRVSDCVRRYLGGRYGFETIEEGYNGLETTTGEMLDLLRRVRPPIAELPRIKAFLDDCDLVKFARLEPTAEECVASLQRGEAIVRHTIPVMTPASPVVEANA